MHAALKAWYARPGDSLEVRVDGYIIDIWRENLLIEIQTRSFQAMKKKLARLTETHQVRLVHPIAQEKWIVRLAADGHVLSRRKSPRHGSLAHIFDELVSFPHLLAHPNFSLEILLIQSEEVQQDDGQGSWRRKGWSIIDRRLLSVAESRILETPADCLAFLPEGLPQAFTNRDVVKSLGQPYAIVQKMTYCLREMGMIQIIGKKGNSYLYCRA
ncbi:MAG: hypothetical protein HY326_07800 [Chloroflexi bacterium]|nr:hypothetical protein [Chloroflexota bacterium]